MTKGQAAVVVLLLVLLGLEVVRSQNVKAWLTELVNGVGSNVGKKP